jgi:hypothetical protein
MKTKLFLVVFLLITFFVKAQSNLELANKYLKERQELVFTFTTKNSKEVQELSKILSIDQIKNKNNLLTIQAYANPEEFEEFLTFNIPFTVNIKLNEPKKVDMYTSKGYSNFSQKGVSAKSTAYPLTFPLATYPTYQQYADQMAAFAADHPAIAQLVDIGGTSGTSSVNPRLLFIKLSDNVSTREREPRVMYTSSMHGDEIAGYPGMLNLINYFITAYENVSDPDHTRVKNLLDNSEVWINPMANPEGTFYGSSTYTSVANSRRANANNVDLNRNYPDNVDGAHPDGKSYQTETLNFMALAESTHFVLSANFHGGTELVNYPFDNAYASTTAYHSEDPSNLGPFYTHPDTDWFEYISVEYATQAQNDSDALGETSYMTVDEDSYIYPSPGVTHGAEWYRVYGGRQDYMNFYHQCREITVEISDVKTPPTTNTSSPDEIIDLWNYNKEAYIKYLIQGTYGFQGVVKDAVTGNPIKAKITLVGHDDLGSWVETELPLGDYYRPVKAGTYDILYEADCHQSYTLTNQTITDYQTIVLSDVLLTPSNAVPSNLSAATSATSATLNWDDAGVTSYDIQYRESGTSTWTTVSSTTNSYNLTGLTASTTYEFQVRSVCNTPSNYSSVTSFTTTAVNYCSSSGNASASDEYIGRVQLGTIDKTSANEKYADFTSLSTNLNKGDVATITITPIWSGTIYNEGYSVWIDYNHDGDFADTGEQVWYKTASKTTPVSGSFTVPSSATLGSTRMRVSLKYNGVPTACGPFTEGEVEDYTVNIVSTVVDTTKPVITLTGTTPVSVEVGSSYVDAGATASDNVDGNISSSIVTVNPVDINTIGSYTITYNVSDSSGNAAIEVSRTVNVVDTTKPVISLTGTTPVSVEVGSSYVDAGATANDNVDGNISTNIVTVNPVDTSTLGSYTITYNVSDSSGNAAIEVSRTVNVVDTLGEDDYELSQFSIYPNPSRIHQITIQVPNGIFNYRIKISNLLGQMVYFKDVKVYNNSKTIIKTTNFRAGVYFVELSSDNSKYVKKLVIE